MARWTVQPRLRFDIGWRDLLSALPPRSGTPDDLEARLNGHAPPDAFVVAALSVRTLFDAILAEAAAGRPVVMSAINIADMVAIAEAHGCQIRTFDLDVNTLASGGRPRTAVDDASLMLVAHLYGRRSPLPAPPPDFEGLVVEDCAQAFDGALTLSSGADVALYSFGPIKTASALGGAIGVFRDAGLADRIKARLGAAPRKSEVWFLKRVARIALLKALSHPVPYGLLLRWLSHRVGDPDAVIGRLARGFPDGDLLQAIRHRPPTRLLRLLDRRLRSWRPAPSGAEEFLRSGVLPAPGHAATGRWWVLPVLHHRSHDLGSTLRARGWDATRGATSLRAVHPTAGEPAMEAMRLMEQVLYLPVPTNEAQASALRDAVRTALEDIE